MLARSTDLAFATDTSFSTTLTTYEKRYPRSVSPVIGASIQA